VQRRDTARGSGGVVWGLCLFFYCPPFPARLLLRGSAATVGSCPRWSARCIPSVHNWLVCRAGARPCVFWAPTAAGVSGNAARTALCRAGAVAAPTCLWICEGSSGESPRLVTQGRPRSEPPRAAYTVGTWYPSDECRIRKVFVCQTMVRRMPIRLPVRKGAFSFVSRLSFVRETFGLGDPLTKPSEQDAGSEGRTSNIGSKNVFDYPVRSH